MSVLHTIALVLVGGFAYVFIGAWTGWWIPPGMHAAPPTTGHPTYAYLNAWSDVSGATLHPGAHIHLHWQAQPDALTRDTTATEVVLSARIVGPFGSRDAARAAWGGRRQYGFTALTLPDIFTTTWTNQPYNRTLVIPPRLTPGYYVLIQSTTPRAPDIAEGDSSTILQVVERH